MAKTGKTSLSDVVEELELQTEGMERQENNLRSFGEALKAQAAQADAAKNARDDLDDLESSREKGPSDAATGALNSKVVNQAKGSLVVSVLLLVEWQEQQLQD